ncbi:MAG: integrase family protein [Rhodoferax sp.]|nr:integrase family protein [Rhodoferax sp.]
MARPKKTDASDLTVTHELSVGLIERLTCPAGVLKAFLRDRDVTGLRVRVTANGAKSFVYEAKLNGKAISRTLGSVALLTIQEAKDQARDLARTVKNDKQDPREVARQKEAAKAAEIAAALVKAEAAKVAAVTVTTVWAVYLAERKPHWSALHYRDHEKMAQAGGEERKRSKGVMTVAGPLAHFMGMRLSDVDADTVQAWAETEGKARPTRTRLALRILKAFLRWAAAETDYKALSNATAASGKKTREMTGTSKPKNDYIQREQLSAWFTHVRQIQNPIIAAYLQCLLLTGARREELAELKWADVNFQWRGLILKDKIEDVRPVPLTPYVAHLLATLPKRNEWVFSSPTSASGRLTEPSIAHRTACAAAGLQVTLHGLRRSFASLCEWLDIPGGISAQIQGHAPQGVREQNYIRRPLDLLRVHHEKIEAWILEHGAVTFEAKAAPGALRVVA